MSFCNSRSLLHWVLFFSFTSMDLQDKTVVITGAGSGIGRALSHLLVKEGCHVALVDIDAEGLERTMAQMPNTDRRISQHVFDLSIKNNCLELPENVLKVHATIDVLINNAGISAYGKFQRLEADVFDRVMDVNFHAPVRLIRAFLPYLRKRPKALIVNMSSIFGIIAPPARSAYAASKFALRGFSQSLRLDLQNGHVKVLTVFPGGVATNIASTVGDIQGWSDHKKKRLTGQEQKLLRMSPDEVAKKVINGLKKEKHHLLIGRDARIASIVERLFPKTYWKKLQALIHRKLN